MILKASNNFKKNPGTFNILTDFSGNFWNIHSSIYLAILLSINTILTMIKIIKLWYFSVNIYL